MNIAKFLIPKVNTVYLKENQTVRQGLERFIRHGYTAIPVLKESGEFYGCIGEGDFLRHLIQTGTTDLREHEHYRIADIMRHDFCPPLTIVASIDKVMDQIQKQNFVPVVDDRNLFCGIATRSDVIRYLTDVAHKAKVDEVISERKGASLALAEPV